MSWLCLSCRGVFEPGGYGACPGCGSGGVPADTEETATVTLTIHELRCLVIWAERFAHSTEPASAREEMKRVVYGIADELVRQSGAALTLMADLAELDRNVREQGQPGIEVVGFDYDLSG